MSEELKPCPFCAGGHIRYSLKVTGCNKKKYQATMYCNDCHCYGARTLTASVDRDDYEGIRKIHEDEDIRRAAIKAWNTRRPIGVSYKQQKEIR